MLLQLREMLDSFKKTDTLKKGIYFKTGPGQYAAHDQFIGVSVPELRKVAKAYRSLPLVSLKELLHSPINEERLLSLLILVGQYTKADSQLKQIIFQFYIENLKQINNWNLVDASAHWIVGAHLLTKDKQLLFNLAESTDLWQRRISIVSTWYFIRHDHFETTLTIAAKLLLDNQDLIHKAVGWMLREAGKRNPTVLLNFLNSHAYKMPRTMLRYSLEKLDPEIRSMYLLAKKQVS